MIGALVSLVWLSAPTANAAPKPPAIAIPLTLYDACKGRDGWADPAPPQLIFGKTWYVGTCGITVVLVETSAGLVLIDSGPAEAAPLVLANIRELGFDPKSVKWILSTHEHFDHAGGIAAIQKQTGARLAVGPFAAKALRTGHPNSSDPQAPLLAKTPMAPARVDRILRNSGQLTVGDVTFTAWATPTHSPGSTSWTWKTCAAASCETISLVDSVTAISADGYRFSDHSERVLEAKMGLTTIEFMPCGILVTPHPGASDLFARMVRKAPLADADACRAYSVSGRTRLNERLAKEAAAK